MPLFRSTVDPGATYETTFDAETERLRSSDSWEEVTDAEPGDGDKAKADVDDGPKRKRSS